MSGEIGPTDIETIIYFNQKNDLREKLKKKIEKQLLFCKDKREKQKCLIAIKPDKDKLTV